MLGSKGKKKNSSSPVQKHAGEEEEEGQAGPETGLVVGARVPAHGGGGRGGRQGRRVGGGEGQRGGLTLGEVAAVAAVAPDPDLGGVGLRLPGQKGSHTERNLIMSLRKEISRK